MAGLYDWVGNIAFYLIFVTVVGSILPNRKYEKYLKLFAGMVLILLVLKPLTSGLRIEDQIAYYFEANTFRSESKDLETQILGIEEQRFQEMIRQYEEAVAKDAAAMALDMGYYCTSAQVTIEADRESPEYGKVQLIEMVVSREEPAGASGGAGALEAAEAPKTAGASGGVGAPKPAGAPQIDPVAPVQVGKQAETETPEAAAAAADDTLNRLRRKVEQYYELEAVDVQIRLEK